MIAIETRAVKCFISAHTLDVRSEISHVLIGEASGDGVHDHCVSPPKLAPCSFFP